jgi:hypothetical protein
MPLVFFLSPTDPRMRGTLDRTMAELVSDSLVHRYEIGRGAGDGLTGSEGTFNMCTFWLVEALARAGRAEEARFIFEKMLTYANHLGLYAEETGPRGEALGNFPQAFTHIGLISAAFNLDRRLGRGALSSSGDHHHQVNCGPRERHIGARTAANGKESRFLPRDRTDGPRTVARRDRVSQASPAP